MKLHSFYNIKQGTCIIKKAKGGGFFFHLYTSVV